MEGSTRAGATSSERNGAMGVTQIRWVLASAKETPGTMEQSVRAFLEARDDSGTNRILLIPSFILDSPACAHSGTATKG